MITECREVFRTGARAIPDWETLSKSELCFKYIENEHDPILASAYFSALVYKYWPLINKYYFMCSNVATQEDVYDWLVDSIQYALKHRRWEDPDSNIYQDPQGPDKVINRRMKCARLTFYQYINRKKRKDNFNMMNIEDVLDLTECDYVQEEENTTYNFANELALESYIHSLFLKKEYFLAFMIDIIAHEEVFEFNSNVHQFNAKKLAKRLRHIDEDYCARFAKKYNVEDNVHECYKKYCRNLSSNLIYNKIEYNLLKLKHDDFFKSGGGGQQC